MTAAAKVHPYYQKASYLGRFYAKPPRAPLVGNRWYRLTVVGADGNGGAAWLEAANLAHALEQASGYRIPSSGEVRIEEAGA